MEGSPEALHRDLVAWGILEPHLPVRFTTRFRGALARSAARLQEKGAAPTSGTDAVARQVSDALAEFLGERHDRLRPAHAAFVRAVHVGAMPDALRRLLGL